MSTARTAPPHRPVPSVLPLLDAGSHRRPEDGSCLMEFVSVLAGVRFTDRPRCTHPVLARLARLVNDGVGDSARSRLAVLAPDLVHTRAADGLVRPVVLARLAAAGLDVDPEDRWLLRLQRRVDSYRGTAGLARRAWLRVTMAGDTTFALGHVATLISRLGPGERDSRLALLLGDAVREVRAASGAQPTPVVASA